MLRSDFKRMPKSDKYVEECNRVSDFYNGKSIFITGAAGFLGSVLLEVLLRCIPGINNIYILVRPKNGIDPESRKKLMFQKWIFIKLLEENPQITDKVHVIPGDVAHPKLGMCNEDYEKVTENVTIVFHAAATVSFFKNLRQTAEQNCLGTKNIVEFCKNVPNLKAFVYTSTAYSNSNRIPEIQERIYSFPFQMKEFMEVLENGKEEEMDKLVSMCHPKWPNNYTLSKCLAENIVNEMGVYLPVAIVRPSIIAPTWKGIRPGYVEEDAGFMGLSLAVIKGFAKVLHCNPKTRFDIIPVDVVANTHIVAAWSIGTQRSVPPFVVNCTGGHVWPVYFEDFVNVHLNMVKTNMLPNSFQEPSPILIKNKYLYFICTLYEHYLPAYFLDVILWMKGKKLRLSRLYNFYDKLMFQLLFFTSTTFDFIVDNFNSLIKQLDPRDTEMFYMDMKDASLQVIANNTPTGSPVFDWSNDKQSPEKRKFTVFWQTLTITFIKRSSLILLCYVFYLICSILF